MAADQYPKGKGGTVHIEKPDEDGYVLSNDSPDTQPGESAVFSELSRLARESKSSWSNFATTPKSDRKFIQLIIITIILLSVITLIAGYRAPSLSLNLGFFTDRYSKISEYLFATEDEVLVLDNQNPQQQQKIAQLESQVAGLKEQANQLKTRNAELEIAAQASLESRPTGKGKSSSQRTLSLVSKPAPALDSKVVSDTPILLRPVKALSQNQGDWFINVGTFSDQVAAETLLTKVQTVLKRAEIQEIKVDNKVLHRIRASGYASQSDAQSQAQRLRSELGLSTWVAKVK